MKSRLTRRAAARLGVLAGAAVLAAGVAVTAWYALGRDRVAGAQHVILISFDTTRADHFGCYGNPWIKTPNVDTLAAESIVLTDYMTVVSTTLASHTSLMTGKYPHTHGVARNGFIVNDKNVMLAELLKAAGFRTAAFLGSFSLDKRFNFDQGFDHFDQEFDILAGEGRADQNQRRAKAVTDAVIAYLDREGTPDRLFLFVHYFDPHLPYNPPPPYDTMYGLDPGKIHMTGHPSLEGEALPRNILDYLRRYAGEVSYMDAQFGRLLDDLKRRGILDNALLIVTSDHGEILSPHAGTLFDHGRGVRRGEMHAVGLIRLPGNIHGGKRTNLPLASIDMLPTIANYLGLPIPVGVEGQAFDLETLGGIARTRIRFGEATKPWNINTDPRWFNNPKPRCVREGPYKYIQSVFHDTESLYDLSTDPHEWTDLLKSPTPEVVDRAAEMRHKLAQWTASGHPLPSHFDRAQYDETVRRLRALGYLSSGDDEDDKP